MASGWLTGGITFIFFPSHRLTMETCGWPLTATGLGDTMARPLHSTRCWMGRRRSPYSLFIKTDEETSGWVHRVTVSISSMAWALRDFYDELEMRKVARLDWIYDPTNHHDRSAPYGNENSITHQQVEDVLISSQSITGLRRCSVTAPCIKNYVASGNWHAR